MCPSNICPGCSCSVDGVLVPSNALPSFSEITIGVGPYFYLIDTSVWIEPTIVFDKGNELLWSSDKGDLVIGVEVLNPNTCPEDEQLIVAEWRCRYPDADGSVCPGTSSVISVNSNNPSLEVEYPEDSPSVIVWTLTMSFCLPSEERREARGQVIGGWELAEPVTVQKTESSFLLFSFSSLSFTVCESLLTADTITLQLQIAAESWSELLSDDSSALISVHWAAEKWENDDTESRVSVPMDQSCDESPCELQFGGNFVTPTGLDNGTFTVVFRGGFLEPGESVQVQTTAVPVSPDDGSVLSGWEEATIRSCVITPLVPPSGGDCLIESPVESLTNYSIECFGWEGENGPFAYIFEIQGQDGSFVAISNPIGPTTSIFFPSSPEESEVQIRVRVCNTRGACSDGYLLEVVVLAREEISDSEWVDLIEHDQELLSSGECHGSWKLFVIYSRVLSSHRNPSRFN